MTAPFIPGVPTMRRNLTEAARIKARVCRLGRLDDLRKAAQNIRHRRIRERHLFFVALHYKRLGCNDTCAQVLQDVKLCARQEALLKAAAKEYKAQQERKAAMEGEYATSAEHRAATARSRAKARERAKAQYERKKGKVSRGPRFTYQKQGHG